MNSPALEDPDLIDQLCSRFGQQCVVVGIDSQPGVAAGMSHYEVHQFTGDVRRSRSTGRDTLEWVVEVQARGAGEIVLNCMSQDGARGGYDLDQLVAVRSVCRVPLVASGGAGVPEHFRDVFATAHVDGALAASVFHSGEIEIAGLKRYLAAERIEVRP